MRERRSWAAVEVLVAVLVVVSGDKGPEELLSLPKATKPIWEFGVVFQGLERTFRIRIVAGDLGGGRGVCSCLASPAPGLDPAI